MNKLTKIIVIISLVTTTAFSQSETKEKNTSLAVNIVHNSVAGFAPVFVGGVQLNDKIDLTFYSIFWTNPTFGTPAGGGDLFLETGIGIGLKPAEGLFINPTLGVGHGKFMGGGNTTTIAEGLIPNILVLYHKGIFEFETYLAYYKAVRNAGDVRKDYFLNWIAPGAKLGKHFSIGAYYELFSLTNITSAEAKPHHIYQWFGGYAKLNLGKGRSARLAAGANVSNTEAVGKEFYKMSVFFPL